MGHLQVIVFLRLRELQGVGFFLFPNLNRVNIRNSTLLSFN
jgi:hypothetical protein